MQRSAAHAISALSAISLLVAAAMLVGLPANLPILLKEALNAAHVVLFAVAAIAALWAAYSLIGPHTAVPQTPHYIWAMLFCLFLAGLTEAVQSLTTNRNADFADFARDISGAAGALGLHLWTTRKKRTWNRQTTASAILVVSVIALVAPLASLAGWTASCLDRWHRFPVLETFEPRPWPTFVSFNKIDVEHMPAKQKPIANTAYGPYPFVKLAVKPGRWPSISLTEVIPDWTDYHAVEFSIFNPDDATKTMGIRIDDKIASMTLSDRFSQHISVSPGMNKVFITLDEIANGPADRRLRLDAIARLIIYAVQPEHGFVIYLSPVVLVPEPEQDSMKE